MRIYYSASNSNTSVTGYVMADDETTSAEAMQKIRTAIARKLGCNAHKQTSSGLIVGHATDSGISVRHNNIGIRVDLSVCAAADAWARSL